MCKEAQQPPVGPHTACPWNKLPLPHSHPLPNLQACALRGSSHSDKTGTVLLQLYTAAKQRDVPLGLQGWGSQDSAPQHRLLPLLLWPAGATDKAQVHG